MVDTNFGKVLEKLKEIHRKYPDLRFGQVVQQAIDESAHKKNLDLHDRNSKQFLRALKEFERKTEQRRKAKKIKKHKGDKL